MGDVVGLSNGSKSRQKNCNGCVQAKRRCDRSTPICSRCAEKRIACSYAKPASELSSGGESRSMDVSMSGQLLGTSADTLMPFDWSTGPTHDDEASGPFMLNLNATESLQDFLMDPSIDVDLPSHGSLGLVDYYGPDKPSQWIAQVNQNASDERSVSPVDEEVLRSYDKMGPVCVRLARAEIPRNLCYNPRRMAMATKPRLTDCLRTPSSRGTCTTQRLCCIISWSG